MLQGEDVKALLGKVVFGLARRKTLYDTLGARFHEEWNLPYDNTLTM